VSSSADGTPHRAKQSENQSDDQDDDPDRSQNRDLRDKPDYQQHNAEDDHSLFS
jgi:hypothetical protein